MTTDLIERLRKMQSITIAGGSLAGEAAAEIERLNAAHKELLADYKKRVEQIDVLDVQVERLKAELKIQDQANDILTRQRDIAVAALEKFATIGDSRVAREALAEIGSL